MSWGCESVLWVLLVVASITDLAWGKIFNAVTFPFFFAGLAYRLYEGGPLAEVPALLGVVAALALFLPLYRLGTLAAGDVKLLMVVGAWAEPVLVLQLGLSSIVVGSVVGGYLLVRKAGARGGLLNV